MITDSYDIETEPMINLFDFYGRRGDFEEGAEVVVYNINGVAVGNATITNGSATISTSLVKGEIAIVNIAGKGIKVVMQ